MRPRSLLAFGSATVRVRSLVPLLLFGCLGCPGPKAVGLRPLIRPEAVPQLAHVEAVLALCWSADGRYLASTDEVSVLLWDTRTKLLVARLASSSVQSCSILKDGRTLLYAQEDGTVGLWDFVEKSSGGRTDRGSPAHLALSPTRALWAESAGEDFVRLGELDPGNGEPNFVAQVDLRDERVIAVSFSPDGDFVGVLGHRGSLHILKTPALGVVSRNRIELARPPEATFFQLLDGGERMLITTGTRSLSLLEVETGAELLKIPLRRDTRPIAAASSNGALIAVATGAAVEVWSLADQSSRTIQEASYSVTALAFDPASLILATGTAGRVERTYQALGIEPGGEPMHEREGWGSQDAAALRLWSLTADPPVSRRLGSRVGTIAAIRASHGSPFLVAAVEFVGVSVLDLRTLRERFSAPSIVELADCVAIDEAGERIAIPSSRVDEIEVLHADDGKVLARFEIPAPGASVAFSHDGQLLAAGDRSGHVSVWDLEARVLRFRLKTGDGTVPHLGFVAGDRWLVAGHSPRSAFAVRIADGTTFPLSPSAPEDILATVVRHRERPLVAVGHWVGLKIWDLTGDAPAEIFAHSLPDPSPEHLASSGVFLPDGRLAIGTNGGAVRVWTWEKMSTPDVWKVGDERILALDADSRRNRLYAAMRDGSLLVLDLGDREPTPAGKLIPITTSGPTIFPSFEGWVALTPDSYYASPTAAVEGLAMRRGLRSYPFDYFDAFLNRPEEALKAVGHASPEALAELRAATERRRAKVGVDADLKALTNLPEIEILGSVPAAIETNVLVLRASIRDPYEALAHVRIYVNGVRSRFRAGEQEVSAAGLDFSSQPMPAFEGDLSIPLTVGQNFVEIEATSANSTFHARDAVEVTHLPLKTQPKPNLWIVSVGVSTYRDHKFDLTYGATDAVDLARILSAQRERFGTITVETLVNTEATRDEVLKQAHRIMRSSRPEDHVVVFFSGHGVLDKEANYRFATHDFDFRNVAGGISFSEIEVLLEAAPARRRLVLLDTCHAGEREDSPVQIRTADADGDPVRGQERPRSHLLPPETTSRVPAARLEDLFVDLRRSTGAVIIGATGGGGFALESSKWKNGAFTFAVREAIELGAADANSDRRLTVAELERYVRRRVGELTAGRQRPATRSQNWTLARDFVAFER
jgi:WD40 repeat protein